MDACKICGNIRGNKACIVREMMFGSRDEFQYIECAGCGCIWLEKVPGNIAGYYPEDYYSFKEPDKSRDSIVESFLNRQKTLYRLNGRNAVGRLLSLKKRKKIMPQYIDWFRMAGVKIDSRILDAGCGNGSLLLSMRKDGFTDLLGIDPYVKSDIIYDCGVNILKKDLAELDSRFDFIMLNHSLEHMPDHFMVFEELRRLLKDKRYVLIRTPVASSFAWREYGVNWVQLDAPRHLFLHSIKSLKILAGKFGFEVVDTVFDPTEFQFWASIQYLKDIPWNDPGSYGVSPERAIFSRNQIEKFKLHAEELNKTSDGDQASYYLYKK